MYWRKRLFLVLFIEVVGNRIEMDGMRLGNFQFGFTLWAAQDFALLDFVLVHIYFGATIGAANHGTILRKNIRGAEWVRGGSIRSGRLWAWVEW